VEYSQKHTFSIRERDGKFFQNFFRKISFLIILSNKEFNSDDYGWWWWQNVEKKS
jgi:hypothetical protein